MLGVFTTTKFASRADFEAARIQEVIASRNRFTNVGLKWMWDMMTGGLRDTDGTLNDHLGAARVVVGNGSQPFDLHDERLGGDNTAQAALDPGFPTINLVAPGVDNERASSVLTVRATFGEDQAAFDWQERGVVTAQGILLDRAVGDQGRKVLGAIWQCQAALYLES